MSVKTSITIFMLIQSEKKQQLKNMQMRKTTWSLMELHEGDHIEEEGGQAGPAWSQNSDKLLCNH